MGRRLLFDDTLTRPYEWGPDELIKMALAYRIVQNLMKQSTGNLGRCIDSCSGMRIAHKRGGCVCINPKGRQVMYGIEKILVPIDFSDPSKKALSYGLSLAVELNATLLLAHVVAQSVPLAYAYPGETQEMTKDQHGEVKAKLRELVHDDYCETLNSRFIVKVGNVEDELLAIATEEKVDLVVMGTHGRRRFERWLMGSVTEHFVRKASVPVMTVSNLDDEHQIEEPGPIPLRRLLYATGLDGTPDRPDKGMAMALMLAREFSAELTVLHVMPQLEDAYGYEYVPLDLEGDTAKMRSRLIERLETALPKPALNDPHVSTELAEGVPYERILELAEERKIDIIILNTHGKSGLERALLGSTAERVVRGAHVPVLSVPPVAESEDHRKGAKTERKTA